MSDDDVDVEIDLPNVTDETIEKAYQNILKATEAKDSAVAKLRDAIKFEQERGVDTTAIKKVIQLAKQSQDKRKTDQSNLARYAGIIGVDLYFQPDLFAE